MNELNSIENKILHLSEELEKLLNILKLTLENGNNDIKIVEDIDLKYRKELENYIEDKNPEINLAIYIFNLIDNIKKNLCEAVDNVYSKNSLTDSSKQKEKIKK